MDKAEERYLSTKELCDMIKYKPQSVYNMIHDEVFLLGVHYMKPSPRKLVFIHSAILEWMKGEN
ncbi:helix-turn-helix transcriptional regulator [Thermodesulfobacteriota bacterium]